MWSLRRTPSIHRNILVSVSFISLSSCLFSVHRSSPYDIVCFITVFIYFMLEPDGYRPYFLDRMCLSESVSPFTPVSLCGAAVLQRHFHFPLAVAHSSQICHVFTPHLTVLFRLDLCLPYGAPPSRLQF